WLYPTEIHQILKDFRDMDDRTGAHLLRILLEAVFPVFLAEELITRQKRKELLYIPALYNLSKTNIAGVCGRNHHQNIVRTYPQEVKTLELTGNQTIRDLFNDPNAMVGIDNLIAYLKCIHSFSPKPQ